MIHPLDFVCLSHLRWNFVYQRPNHLMSRAAREHRVYFWEEPIIDDGGSPNLEISEVEPRLLRVVPHMPRTYGPGDQIAAQQKLLGSLFETHRIERYLTWYYTPMALEFSRHLEPELVVYDCMDELSGFAGAPPVLRDREAELMKLADIVFTGGQSLFEAKRDRHPNIFPFPSSVDVAHFSKARTWVGVPPDQAVIPRPRLGYFGVIDERMDLALVAGLADAHPEWSIVMIGPTAKIDPAALPHRPNIHYLGLKRYEELPAYLATWDVAMMPFAINDATRFISPTKTPEYLAAGKPVVSTPIRDVVRPYGDMGIVKIASTVEEFGEAVAHTLGNGISERAAADRYLADLSWDKTWQRMMHEIERTRAEKSERAAGTRVSQSEEDGTCLTI